MSSKQGKANFNRALDHLAEHGISVSRKTLWKWLQRGLITGQRIGNRWYVDYAVLDDVIENGTPEQKSIVKITE